MTAEARRSSEFDRIARYFASLAESVPGAFGLLDDAAVISPSTGTELVVTTDTIVAGVHYVGDEAPGLVAAKLLRVNLSDLAAMGATPRAYTLNIALPANIDDRWLEAFAAGLAEDQQRYGVALIGGDSVGTSGPAVFSLTAFGEVPVGGALRRCGARPGDGVYVSGTIGDGALGLLVVQEKLRGLSGGDSEVLAARYRRPEPRLALGKRLHGLAHAVADISDGLVADLIHIANASAVAATIESAAIPLSSAGVNALAGNAALQQTILTGGDDYELIFCVPSEQADAVRALAQEIDVPLTAVGVIAEGAGVRVVDAEGREITLQHAGFTHG